MSILVATCGGMQCDDRLSRHATRTRRATRGLVATYALSIGVAWLAAPIGAGYRCIALLGHVLSAWAVHSLDDVEGRLGDALRALGLPVFVALLVREAGLVGTILRIQDVQQFVTGWDVAMLAERLRVAQASIMPVWFGQSMRALYPLYYPALALPPVILLMTGRWPELAEVRFRMLLTCLACLVIRTAFPALGSAGQALPGFVAIAHGLTDAMPQLGPLLATEMPTTFPVSHVAGAVTMVVIAWRFWGRRVAVGFSTLAFAIVLATFFVQGLLVLEPIMSLLLVLILQYAVAPLLLGSRPRLQRWFGRLGAGRRVDAEGRRFHRGSSDRL